MFCLRCGREIEDAQVFCARCLDASKDYPIKPGTAVQLPERHKANDQKPAPRRRQLTGEEQIAQLKATVRVLIAAVTLLSLVLGGTAWLLLRSLDPPAEPAGNLGRNYTASETVGD